MLNNFHRIIFFCYLIVVSVTSLTLLYIHEYPRPDRTTQEECGGAVKTPEEKKMKIGAVSGNVSIEVRDRIGRYINRIRIGISEEG